MNPNSIRIAATCALALLTGCVGAPRDASRPERVARDVALPPDVAAAIAAHVCRESWPGGAPLPGGGAPLRVLGGGGFRITWAGDTAIRAGADAGIAAVACTAGGLTAAAPVSIAPVRSTGATRIDVEIHPAADGARLAIRTGDRDDDRRAALHVAAALQLGEALVAAHAELSAGRPAAAIARADAALRGAALPNGAPGGPLAAPDTGEVATLARLKAALHGVASLGEVATGNLAAARQRLATASVLDSRVALRSAAGGALVAADPATLRALTRAGQRSGTARGIGVLAAAQLGDATALPAPTVRDAIADADPDRARFTLARAVAALTNGAGQPELLATASQAAIDAGLPRTGIRLLSRYPELAARIEPARLRTLAASLHAGVAADTARRVQATEAAPRTAAVTAADRRSRGFELAPGVAPQR